MSSHPSLSSEPFHEPIGDSAPELFATALGLLERGEWAWAISLYERALASDPAYAAGWLELGNAHMQAECLPEAIDAYQRAISLDATLSEAQANLAIAYREQGRPDAAIAAYRAALAHDPSDVEALLDLGLLLQEQEQWEEAFEAFQRARELSPSSSLLLRMADLLLRQEDLEGAVNHYRQALHALADTDGEEVQAQILGRLGVALHQLGHLEDAIHCYGLALRLRSGWLAINNHRNTALERLKGTVSQARQTLYSLPALAGDPAGETGVDDGPESRAQLLQTLAVVLHRAGCLEEAIASYGQALELQPELEAAQALRAKALEQRQDPTFLLELARRFNLLALYDDELHTLEQAAALAPDNRSIQLELGFSLLRCGHFQAGWPVFTKLRHPLSDAVGLAQWQPHMACDRLLILPEEGLGDQIMFASLLGETAALAPERALLVDPRLHPLLARSFPDLRLLAMGRPLHGAPSHAQVLLGSLGAHLRPSQNHFLAQRKAYLRADPAKTQALRRRHHTSATTPCAVLCGISWRSVSPANGVMKSISLEALAGALALPGVRLLSLQYGDTRSELEELRRNTGLEVIADPEIDTYADIDDLAALIAACDLVVSVANTTAHLAGALGQRTCLLIDSRLDWRWGLHDPESLWYPNMRLFRQRAAGDWSTPLRDAQTELRALRMRESGAGAAPPPTGKTRWVF